MHKDDFDEPQGHSALGFPEFIALVAAIMSTQALAVDAMLPALPRIVHELHVPNPNHGQWVVTTYVAGIGLGQLFWGVAWTASAAVRSCSSDWHCTSSRQRCVAWRTVFAPCSCGDSYTVWTQPAWCSAVRWCEISTPGAPWRAFCRSLLSCFSWCPSLP